MATHYRRTRIALAAAFFAACMCTAAAWAADGAAGAGNIVHRARLSADLQDHLDAGSQSLEAIVHGTKASCDALARAYGLVVRKYLSNEGCVFRLTAGQLAVLREDDTQDHISGNIKIKSSDEVTAQTIGADQVWEGYGELPELTGKGIVVAVVDSGIDQTHAALKGKVVATHDFTGGDGVDRFGHGTHVAGIIAGAWVRTPDGHDYRGIAPGARIVNLRVLDDTGSGTVADVVEAIDWAVAHRAQFKIRVINLSLGAPVLQSYHDDPMCEAVERAVRAGIVVVAAAGNYGHSADGKTVLGSIVSPGNSPYALTVGAVDTHGTPERSDDTVATYSSRGPTAYDLLIKPDLAAPGSHIASAEAAGGYLGKTYPERHVTGTGPNAMFQLSGTSMAAAVVSGATSLLLDQRASLWPLNVKMSLQSTCTSIPAAGLVGAGSGDVNLKAASMSILENVNDGASSDVLAGQFVFALDIQTQTPPNSRNPLSAQARALILRGGTLVWGATDLTLAPHAANGLPGTALTHGSTLVWSARGTDTLVWGSTLVWGAAASNTLVWGATGTDTLVWGASEIDTLAWRNALPDLELTLLEAL